MSKPDPTEDYFLEAIAREEAAAEEARIKEASQEWTEKQAERPDWWTPRDADLAKTLLEKPEGFLAQDEMFRRGNVVQVVGHRGSYKTWLAEFMMGQGARGAPIAHIPTREWRSLLLSEELPIGAVLERAEKLWSKADRDEMGDMVAFREDSNLDFFARANESKRKLDWIIKHTNDPDLILIDAQSYIHHGDENSNRDMGIVYGALKDVAKVTGTCIAVIHHAVPNEDGEVRKGRGATVVGDICADILVIEPIYSKSGGRPQSRARFSGPGGKHRDLRNLAHARPFIFAVEDHPAEPNRVVFTFSDEQPQAAAKPADMAAMRETVEELAGDGEVLREALWSRLVVNEKWGKLRFKATLSECVAEGSIGRSSRGKDAAFFIPKSVDRGESDAV
jgi:AAA domain